MKNASRILYKIGKVFSIIAIVCCVLMLVFCVFGIAMKDEVYQKLVEQGTEIASVEEMLVYLIVFMAAMAISIVIEAIRIKFVGQAISALDTAEKKPHIVLLVLSVIADTSIFYLLASIFGLVIASQNEKKPEQVQTTEQQ